MIVMQEQSKRKGLKRGRSLATKLIEDGNDHSVKMSEKISKGRRASQIRLEKRLARKKKSGNVTEEKEENVDFL